jgi:hypothetical protein
LVSSVRHNDQAAQFMGSTVAGTHSCCSLSLFNSCTCLSLASYIDCCVLSGSIAARKNLALAAAVGSARQQQTHHCELTGLPCLCWSCHPGAIRLARLTVHHRLLLGTSLLTDLVAALHSLTVLQQQCNRTASQATGHGCQPGRVDSC